MKTYEVLSPLRTDPGKPAHAVGKRVSLDPEEAVELEQLGIVKPVPGKPDADADDTTPPLSKMNLEDLRKQAAAESVVHSEDATKAQIIEAIDAKRKKDADEGASGGPPNQ